MIYERKDIQTTFWQKRIWRKYDSTRAQVIICDVSVMLHNIINPINSVVFGLVEEPMNIGFPWTYALLEFRYGSLRVNHNVPHPPKNLPHL